MKNSEKIQEYFTTHINSLDGWFYPIDALLFAYISEIQEQCSFYGNLCEVGVFKGKSLSFLCLMANELEKVYGIDLYDGSDYSDTLKTIFTVTGDEKSAVLIQENSLNITFDELVKIIGAPLRFLHIDAGHLFEEVLSDLEKFSQLMSPIGVVVLDDYYDRAYPGICAAVHSFLINDNFTNFVPFAIGANKIYLCNPSLANHYQRQLITKPHFQNDLRLQVIHKNPVLIPYAGKQSSDAEKIRQLLDNNQQSGCGESFRSS